MLFVIFFVALLIRFLYFPNNIYFGYDQARDAFSSLEILHGNLKIIGPTTAFEQLHHGVLYYYILAPLYGLGNLSPEFTAAALRVFNALGVFLIFIVAKTIFSTKVGFFAAVLFAISFEQTQFSIYMGNPTLAVLSVTLMYLGLALVFFKKQYLGLPLAFLGLGASIQFQFALTYLVIPLILILIFFRKSFYKIPLKILGLSFLSLLISLSTFLIAELKYNFPTFHGLLALNQFNPHKSLENIINTYAFTVNRMIMYNFTDNLPFSTVITLLLLVGLAWFLRVKEYRNKIVFLGIWFFSIILTFIINGGVADLNKDLPLFYPNVGVSVSLLIFASFLLSKMKTQIATVLIIFIIFANLISIQTLNPKGTISEINVQQGMILGSQKKVIDYIYGDAKGEAFAVKTVTMPFFINTTWSYLFEWYGQSKYKYLPIWNGKNALGYAGNLKVLEVQEDLPQKRYLIIEPVRGIAPYLIDDYLKEEGYFTKVIEERKIGLFTVQKREKI